MIVALQDETLKSAVERVKTTPVVFNVLSDPFAAGAGTSDSVHLPNITGVYSPGLGDPEQRARGGADPEGGAERQAHRRAVQPARAAGGEHEGQDDGVGEGGGPDGGGGADQQPDRRLGGDEALIAKKVGAIEIYGNAAHAAFESIIKEAKENKIPVFSPSPFEVVKGATAAFFPDFQEGGVVAGGMVAKALKGESLATVPFYKLETTKTSVAGENPATPAPAQ